MKNEDIEIRWWKDQMLLRTIHILFHLYLHFELVLQTIAITMQAIGLCICVYIYDIVIAIVNEKLLPVSMK